MIQLQFQNLITIEELSTKLDLNPSTLYRKIREQKFPKGIKVDGRRYFKVNEITTHYNQMGIEVVITQKSEPSYL
jgi:predicted DNA-binding transcriptional regulator AlpA